jgi:hypothetical protein
MISRCRAAPIRDARAHAINQEEPRREREDSAHHQLAAVPALSPLARVDVTPPVEPVLGDPRVEFDFLERILGSRPRDLPLEHEVLLASSGSERGPLPSASVCIHFAWLVRFAAAISSLRRRRPRRKNLVTFIARGDVLV